jgi:hypothetical protein
VSTTVLHARARSPDWFYVWVSAFLFLLIVVGFSQTYYLRSVIGTAHLPPGVQELPAHLHWHGLILSAWFVLALVQPTLIASRRPRVHRLLGWVGVGVAGTLVAVTLMVLARAVPEPATGVPPEALPLVIAGDLAILAAFSILVTAAVMRRRDREAHLRLMLLASISIAGPAVSRLPGALPMLPVLLLTLQIGVPVVLMIHDRIRLGRVHGATIFGAALIFSAVVVGVAIGSSSAGAAIMDWLT